MFVSSSPCVYRSLVIWAGHLVIGYGVLISTEVSMSMRGALRDMAPNSCRDTCSPVSAHALGANRCRPVGRGRSR